MRPRHRFSMCLLAKLGLRCSSNQACGGCLYTYSVSRRQFEQLVDEPDLTSDSWLPQDAVPALDHTHYLEPLNGCISGRHRLEGHVSCRWHAGSLPMGQASRQASSSLRKSECCDLHSIRARAMLRRGLVSALTLLLRNRRMSVRPGRLCRRDTDLSSALRATSRLGWDVALSQLEPE